MGINIKDLKTAKTKIIDDFKISASDAARVVGYINSKNTTIIQDILSGDCSGVPAVLSALDIQAAASLPASPLGGSASVLDKIPADSIQDNTSQNTADIIPQKNTSHPHDIIPAIDGDIIPASTDGDLLPAALPSMVEDWLQEYALKYKIDLQKCAGLQWRGACLFVGQHFKNSDILLDKERTLSRNSKTYNPHKVAALIPLYEALTVTYKHIALACDFIAFSGVSREWFYDSQNKGLTSAAVDLRKKVLAIEESTLSVGLVDSREIPTGRIYYSKARLGWQETAPAVSAPVAVVVAVGDLPTLLDKKQ